MVTETQSDSATPLDPNEAEGLIPTHVSTREELNRMEQENIVEALQWLETARPKHILDEAFIRTPSENVWSDLEVGGEVS